MPEVEEVRVGDPAQMVLHNARRKARAALGGAGGGRPILGVDTDVVLDGRALGKADGRVGARRRLAALSGRTHSVLSGVVILSPGSGGEAAERSGVARSSVTFRELDETTIEVYLSSGEWSDRAGAYAVQGLGSMLIERVEGDLSNVVGLPVTLLFALAPELFGAAPDSAPEASHDPKP